MTGFFTSGCGCVCFPPLLLILLLSGLVLPPRCPAPETPPPPTWEAPLKEGGGGAGPQLGGLGCTPSSCPSWQPHPGCSSVTWSVSVSCVSAGLFLPALLCQVTSCWLSRQGLLRLELPWMVFMFQVYRSRASLLPEYGEVTWFREGTHAARLP